MSDDGLKRLERRLESADFSAQSRVREPLRSRLLAPRPRAKAPRVAGLALVLSAAALLILAPLARRAHRPEVESVTVASRLLEAPAPPAPAPRGPRFPRGANGLPVLPGRLAAYAPPPDQFPILTRRVDGVFETRPTSLQEIFVTRAL